MEYFRQKSIVLSKIVILFILLINPSLSFGEDNLPISKGGYVGSETCKVCHKKEYDNFIKYAKKARSFESIERLKRGLTDKEIKKCYSCHTTGYGKGGFESPEKTPHLRNAGCEVCHGPGSLHVRTKNPHDIKGHLGMEDCIVCHTEERVKAFRFKPMIHGGAH